MGAKYHQCNLYFMIKIEEENLILGIFYPNWDKK